MKPRDLRKNEPGSVGGLVRVALEIAHEQAELLKEMRAAFESGDNSRAIRCAKQLCGIEASDESQAHH
jgi:hypothetical protein